MWGLNENHSVWIVIYSLVEIFTCLQMMCCSDCKEDGTLYIAHASRNLSKTQNILDSKTLVLRLSDIKLRAYTYIMNFVWAWKASILWRPGHAVKSPEMIAIIRAVQSPWLWECHLTFCMILHTFECEPFSNSVTELLRRYLSPICSCGNWDRDWSGNFHMKKE